MSQDSRDLEIEQLKAQLQRSQEEELRLRERCQTLQVVNQRLLESIEETAGPLGSLDQGNPADLERVSRILRERDLRLQLALEVASDGLWDWNIRTGEVYFSPRWLETLGYTAEEMPPHVSTWERIVHPDDLPRVRAALTAHFEGRVPVYECENRLRTRSGQYRWNLDRGRVVERDADGRPVRMIGIDADINQRKLAEEQLRASLDEKETLVREVHHRVKNNLAIIDGLLDLQAGKVRSSVLEEVFRDCQNRIRSMAVIHEQLYRARDLARIDFAAYLRELCRYLFLSHGVDRQRIQLNLEVAEFPLELDLAVPLGLLINELVSNTLKHGFPEGRSGTVSVRLSEGPPGRVVLVVADDGIGLPADIEVLPTRSLGFRLIQILTRQLGGTIEFENEHGTTVRVCFSSSARGRDVVQGQDSHRRG